MPDAPTLAPTEIRRDAEAKQRAIRCLWQLDGAAGGQRQAYLYAILDAARDERIYPRLRRLAATEQMVGLYQGRAATEMAAVAPYLVCLGSTDRVFDWLWEEGWGESWGIFLWSLVSLEALRTHFRRLTMVRTEDGSRLLFRFYDPRVLREFLPTCDGSQLRQVFGPVISYLAETPGADAVISFRRPEKLDIAATGLLTQVLRDADSALGAAARRGCPAWPPDQPRTEPRVDDATPRPGARSVAVYSNVRSRQQSGLGMLVITQAQMDAFEREHEARLLARAEIYLSHEHAAWAQGRSADEIRALIGQMRAFGLAHKLREEASLLRLIDQALGDGWPDPLPALAVHLLTRRGFSEARRVADGRGALTTGLTLIDLGQSAEGLP